MPTSLKHVVLLKSGAQNQGGLEKYADRLAKAFIEKGAEVSLLTTGEAKSQGEIQTYSCQTSSWPPGKRMEEFDLFTRNWIEKNSPDLIFGMDRNRYQTHIRAGNGVHAAYLKSRRLTEGRLKTWICKINPMHRKILELEKAAFENPKLKKLFANSQMVKKELLEHYEIAPEKIEVIHNGVEWTEMEEDFEKSEFSNEEFHFLFIGNGYLRKGLSSLLQALSHLKEKNFRLSVVGKENKVDLFKVQAEALGLKKKVHFFGAQADITPFYQKADALVIPSYYDPFANVTIEAIAMGLFTISSKTNGGSEIITKENGAIIEDMQKTESFVFALEEAMKRPKTKISSLLIRQSVEHLDFSKQLKRLIDACE